MNIVVISNITLEPFFSKYLKSIFAEEGFNVKVYSISYNEAFLKEKTNYYIEADHIIICLNLDCLYPNLQNDLIGEKIKFEDVVRDIHNEITELYTVLKQKSRASVIWMGTEDYCYYPYSYSLGYSLKNKGVSAQVNALINKMLVENDSYVDLKAIIAQIGIEHAFDNKSKYRWNMPYSREVMGEIAQEVYKQHLICNGITKKCLVLDCDNVLWGGIISEDGIDHVQLGNSGLGRSFQDFQRFILHLYYHGVIIAICSRNDMADVLRMFKEHDEMILKEEHIACFCVNWENKPDNIKRISETLNIGLDSIVFIDDSNFEIQSVKKLLPQVSAIRYDKEHVYKQLSCFNLPNRVDATKIKQRNLTYQTNEYRRALKLHSSTFDEYLNALEMRVKIHRAGLVELSRIAELSQRTNKCTNGIRYTVEQLKGKLENGYALYSILLSDKFSNLGLVGAIGIEENTLDLFSLSCRALGRNVEELMINFVEDRKISNVRYNLTDYNRDLYNRLEELNIKFVSPKH